MVMRKLSRKYTFVLYAVMLALAIPVGIKHYKFYKSAHPTLPSPAPFSEADIINFVRHDLGKTIAVEHGSSREEHMKIVAPYMADQGNTNLADDLEQFGWFDGKTATYVDFIKPVKILQISYLNGYWSWITQTRVTIDVSKEDQRETKKFYAVAFVGFKEGVDAEPKFSGIRLRTEPLKRVSFSGLLP